MVDQLSTFADEVTRVAREVGTEGRLGGQAQVKGVSGVWRGLTENVNTLARQPHRPGTEHRRGDDCGRERRPLAQDHRRGGRRGRRAEEHGQPDGRPAVRVRGRGHACRARGRHRRPAGRPGAGQGRLGRVEGPHGQREHARGQPHVPGAEHRRGHDGGRDRRPLEADHRRRQGRGARAQGDHQHDGRPAALVRCRGHSRRARGRHRGPARRTGRGRRRYRCLARPDREREHHGRLAHLAGAEHRRRDDGRRDRRSEQEDHGRGARRAPRAQGDDQHDGRPALDLRGRGHPRRARGRNGRPARRPGGGRGRVGRVARPDRERELHGRLAHHAGARDRRRVDRRDPGRPDSVDRRRGEGRGLGPEGQRQPDDLDASRHDAAKRRAGLAQLEPRAVRRDDAGPARPEGGLEADHERADAARPGAPRGVLRGRRRGRRREAPARLELRLQAAQEGRERVQGRRGARRPDGAREAVDPDHRPAGRLHPDRVGAGRGRAAQHHRDARPLRGRGDGRDRARRVPRLHSRAADVHGAARRDDRRRAEHDPGEHADRGAARPVAVARAGAAEPVGRAPDAAGGAPAAKRGARGDGGDAPRVRGAAPAAAGGAPADERGARGEGPPARGAERADRDQEPGDRARALGARGEGRAARALVEVQERVPGEHVARAANAAQLAADPREAARRQPRRQPDVEAGRVLVDDPLGGLGPARPDQRHPRPLEGGGREDGPRGVGDPAHRAPRADRARVPAGRRAEAARVRGHRERRERAADDRHRPAAAGADPAEPALERVQVHRRRKRVAQDRGRPDGRPLHERAAEPRGRRRGVRRLRHGDRDPARQAAPDLRGVPAGRRDDEPPLRRHRARALDQP